MINITNCNLELLELAASCPLMRHREKGDQGHCGVLYYRCNRHPRRLRVGVVKASFLEEGRSSEERKITCYFGCKINIGKT